MYVSKCVLYSMDFIRKYLIISESPKPEDGRKCTACKKLVKGHKRPVGRLCENKDNEHIGN